MTPGPDLRTATPADVGALAALDAAVFAGSAYPEASWSDEIANPAGSIWLALAGAQAIGFVSVLAAGDDIEIRKIGVLPEFRRKGIAKKLIHHAMTLGNARRCLIDVSALNETGIAFYHQLGFRDLARRKKYYADGSDALVMEFIK